MGNNPDDKMVIYTFPLRFPYELTATISYIGHAMKHRDYLSFLVRVWRVNVQERNSPKEKRDTSMPEVEWRASIEYSLDSARINFGNLESLFEYIRKLTVEPTNNTDKDR